MSGRDMVKIGPAWAAAVLATTVMACLIQSWQVQSGLADLGVDIPPGLAAQTAIADLLGMALPVLMVFGIAMALGFMAAGWLKPRLPLLAPIAWPLAGATAIAAALGLMHLQYQMTPLAGARGTDGFLLFCGAGALGGLIFDWLRPR
ncbi:MAG: hypothetical protein KGQ52_10495 [Alphaproteobacteria bacterium]|nr:hypothetical protein [Alphaproteobacteria bacterium]